MKRELNISKEDFTYIQKLVYEYSKVVINDDKDYFVESRLASVARQEKLSSIHEVISKLKADKKINGFQKIVSEAMMTYETSFFRDLNYFQGFEDLLVSEIVPSLPKTAHVNIWSAASSLGQEIYSIAMLIENAYSNNESNRFKLFASDISDQLLTIAKEGVYNNFEVTRGLCSPFQKRFLEKKENDWQVVKELRNRIDFQNINITKDLPYLPKMDVIFLRNVLIYFNAKDKAKVVENIGTVLKPGGILIIGSTESLEINNELEKIDTAKMVYYKKLN